MRLLKYLTALLIVVFFAACGGGGGAPGLPSGTLKPITTTAPSALTVAVASTQGFTITGGRTPYQISSSNVQVATGVVDGANFSITGIAGGTATIIISDAAQQTSTIAVTVGNSTSLYSTAPSTINLSPSSTASYLIGGGVPGYTVSSTDTRIVSASISGSVLTVNSLAIGGATITIRDSANTTIQLAVTVGIMTALYSTAPSTINLSPSSNATYIVGGGVPGYTVSSTDTRIVSASISGSVLTVNSLAIGGATITIRDSSNTTIQLAVNVGSLTSLYSTAPSTVNLSPSSNATYVVGGGVPGYSVSSTDTRIVSASISGSVLTVNTLAIGAATVTVRDSANTTIQFAVTVGNLVGLYTTVPSSLTIANGTTRSFVVGGGSPGYLAESTDNRVVVATLTGGTLTLRGVSIGSASVVVRDTVNNVVLLSITVGGTSTLGLYTSAPAALTVAKGSLNNYSVGGGAEGYTAVSSDSRVATVTLSGSTMSIRAIALGTATVTIKDAAGAALNIAVTVAGTSSETFFTTAPSSLAMSTGTSLTYSLSGGSQPYSVASTDSRVATGAISGTSLTISALKAGTATLQLVDAVGKVLQIVVTVDGAAAGGGGVAAIDIQASSNTLPSTPGSKVTFVVTVKDAVNAAIPNQAVTVTSTSGTLTGTNPAPTTDVNGVISTISLLPGADASNRIITVTVTAGGISKSINIPVVGTTVSVAGAGSALVGSGSSTYSIKAQDSAGKPVVGATLSVTSSTGNTISPSNVTTDVSGAATFSFTPVNPGTDTLTVTGLGTSATATVAVSNQDFSFTAPVSAAQLVVNTSNVVQVCYKVSGVNTAPTSAVTFSTTRGTLGGTLYPDAQGCTSTTVSSSTAGPVTISAQMGTVRSSVTAAFIATVPATIVLQANPGAVLPNVSGSTTNQSTLSAIVRDATGNPVSNQVVNFTAITDGSNGSIVPGSGTTDANGQTTVQFIPGALSTAANGVKIRATVQSNPALFSDATLTVNGNALFISIGIASTIIPLDAVTYQKQFSVYVTDANGAPAANRAVTVSVFPTTYGKGSLTWDDTAKQWVYETPPPTKCVNEDTNRNGILDSGEDINHNGKLDPGLPVVISPSTVTTDTSGNATFFMSFGKNYAWWLWTEITARASVGGTESTQVAPYSLEMVSSDATSKSSPPNKTSPFGKATVCTDPT